MIGEWKPMTTIENGIKARRSELSAEKQALLNDVCAGAPD